MSKYSGLADYLRAQSAAEVPMTFSEIERVTGTTLPPKAQFHPAWWSNNPGNNVMTKVWLSAGFRSERIDIKGRTLVFRRVASQTKRISPEAPAAAEMPRTAAQSKHHPLYGALRGLFRIMPGTDLTKPADPDWSQDD